MKVDLQDLLDSAKLCKRELVNGGEPYAPNCGICVQDLKKRSLVEDWNPPTSPAQDREILKALLARGYDVRYCSDDDIGVLYQTCDKDVLNLQCDPDDFLTKAGAWVWREAKEGE